VALVPFMRQLGCEKPKCTCLDLSGQDQFGEHLTESLVVWGLAVQRGGLELVVVL
jgi:hypothetical protein